MLPSLHTTYHHHINHIVLNINNPTPSSYKRKMWHYDRVQSTSIVNSMGQFDWKCTIGVLAHDPNFQVKLLTDVVTNFIKIGCSATSRVHIEFLKQERSKLVTNIEEKYLISQWMKLSNSGTNIQQFWAIINYFLNIPNPLLISINLVFPI